MLVDVYNGREEQAIGLPLKIAYVDTIGRLEF